MREILFRGMYKKTWVYGSFIDGIYDGKKFAQIENADNIEHRIYEVDPGTVCQFIGQLDKGKIKIFESDIVIVPEGYSGDSFHKKCFAVVRYEGNAFYLHNISDEHGIVWQDDFGWDELEIIGNIFQNKDMLK